MRHLDRPRDHTAIRPTGAGFTENKPETAPFVHVAGNAMAFYGRGDKRSQVILLNRVAHFETWSKFPRAQSRLFRTVREAGGEGVVFLAGDQHYGEASRLAGVLGYDAVEPMFAGINQEEPHVPNTRRVSPVAHAKNAYALIDIQWHDSDDDLTHLVFRCFDADRDAPELTYRVNLDALTLARDR